MPGRPLLPLPGLPPVQRLGPRLLRRGAAGCTAAWAAAAAAAVPQAWGCRPAAALAAGWVARAELGWLPALPLRCQRGLQAADHQRGLCRVQAATQGLLHQRGASGFGAVEPPAIIWALLAGAALTKLSPCLAQHGCSRSAPCLRQPAAARRRARPSPRRQREACRVAAASAAGPSSCERGLGGSRMEGSRVAVGLQSRSPGRSRVAAATPMAAAAAVAAGQGLAPGWRHCLATPKRHLADPWAPAAAGPRQQSEPGRRHPRGGAKDLLEYVECRACRQDGLDAGLQGAALEQHGSRAVGRHKLSSRRLVLSSPSVHCPVTVQRRTAAPAPASHCCKLGREDGLRPERARRPGARRSAMRAHRRRAAPLQGSQPPPAAAAPPPPPCRPRPAPQHTAHSRRS